MFDGSKSVFEEIKDMRNIRRGNPNVRFRTDGGMVQSGRSGPDGEAIHDTDPLGLTEEYLDSLESNHSMGMSGEGTRRVPPEEHSDENDYSYLVDGDMYGDRLDTQERYRSSAVGHESNPAVHWSEDPTLTDEGRDAAKLAELRDLALSDDDLIDLQPDEDALSL